MFLLSFRSLLCQSRPGDRHKSHCEIYPKSLPDPPAASSSTGILYYLTTLRTQSRSCLSFVESFALADIEGNEDSTSESISRWTGATVTSVSFACILYILVYFISERTRLNTSSTPDLHIGAHPTRPLLLSTIHRCSNHHLSLLVHRRSQTVERTHIYLIATRALREQ